MKRPGFKALVIFLVVAALILPGCSKKNSQEKKPQNTSSQKTKAPQDMKTLNQDLEKIIAGLEEKMKATSKSGLQQSMQQSQQTQQGQQQQGQSQNQQGQSGQSQQGQQNQSGQSQQGQSSQQGKSGQSQSQSGQTGNKWQTEVQSIMKIHQEWNKIEPEAVKAGLSSSSRDAFEAALDKLTQGISKQDTKASLTAAIDLYGQYANLVEKFDSKVPADYYRLKYEVMSAGAEAGQDDWKAAQARVPQIKEYWNIIKMQDKIKDPNSLNTTEYALQDLEDALKMQDPDILMIKIDIALKNLQKIEKKLSGEQG